MADISIFGAMIGAAGGAGRVPFKEGIWLKKLSGIISGVLPPYSLPPYS
jgi:hypothetical protein